MNLFELAKSIDLNLSRCKFSHYPYLAVKTTILLLMNLVIKYVGSPTYKFTKYLPIKNLWNSNSSYDCGLSNRLRGIKKSRFHLNRNRVKLIKPTSTNVLPHTVDTCRMCIATSFSFKMGFQSYW